MQRRISATRHLRTGGWALALAAGLTIAAGSAANAAPADGLPVPLPALPSLPAAPKLPVPVPTLPALPDPVQTLIGTVTGPLAGLTSPTPKPGTPSVPGAPSLPGLPSLPGVPSTLPSQVTGPLSGVGTQLKNGLNQVQQGAKGTPLEKVFPNGAPGSVLNLGINANPLGTACVQATGTGTAVANATITIGGQNITAPLVQALPGVLAACPAGSIPSKPGVKGSIGGLVGLCVSVDKAPPLKATILALNTDILGQLTSAGVPLQQVVVPCPKGTPGTTGGHTGGGTHPGGGSGHGGGTTSGSHTGSGATSGSNSANANGNGSGNGSSCAASTAKNGSGTPLDLQTMRGVLPHSPASTLPWLLLALVVLCRNQIVRVIRKVIPVRS